jgi:hypothetical protein
LPLRPQQELDIATTVAPPGWTVKDAEKLYNMNGWGLGYFRVNADGHVTVHPDANRKRGLDLYHLATDLHAQGVGLPLLLRFSDILKSRIEALSGQFATAIKEFGYEGSYTTVYPVKVNQQRHVVQEIVEFGTPYGVGLVLTAPADGVLDDSRIVFFGVADRPVRAVAAEAAVAGLDPGTAAGEHAAAALAGELVPDGDLNAPPAMKLHLAKVLLRRAIADLAGETE